MAAAQNLSKGKSNTVAVLIPEIANPYFAAAFEGISEVADENHFNVFFYNTSAKPEKEEDAIYSMKTQGVRGAIITPSVDFENIESTPAGIRNCFRQLGCQSFLWMYLLA